jgi:preprotein translocase subunit SecE
VESVTESKAVRRDGRAEKRTSPVTFYRQVVAELRKVVWPTQEQLVTYFLVTMVFVVFFMAMVSLLDLGFGKLVFEIFTGQDTQ